MNENMQPSEVCRICGGTGLFLDIFDPEKKYCKDLEDCLSVKVKPNDGRSQVICHNCLGMLSWCKAYVNKVNLLKKNSSPSSKSCYSCRSAIGNLFPLPAKSAEHLQELFALSVPKSKTLKICPECQFSLDCVYDLREKADTALKLSQRGQHLQFEVSQKNASVDDLVCSLKDRKVELDAGTLTRRLRISKSPQTPNKGTLKHKNGMSIDNSVANSMKRKSSSGKEAASKEKSSRQNARESSSLENGAPSGGKQSKQMKRRSLNQSSDSELNTSTESTGDSKCKRLYGSDENLNDSRPSRDSNNSKQTGKRSLSPVSKRSKLDKSTKCADSQSDSESDSVCLASLIDSDGGGKKSNRKKDESPKKSGRKLKTSEAKVHEVDSPQKSSIKKSQAKENVSTKSGKGPETSRASRKVHFQDKTESKKKKQIEESPKPRKKRVNAKEHSSDEEEVQVKRKKIPPMQEYTCTICSQDFDSTVVGKRHELSHDERFDKFEIKLVRMSTSEIASASVVSTMKTTSANDAAEEDDDLWNIPPVLKKKKVDNNLKEDAFDALFGSESKDEHSNNVSSSVEQSDSQNAPDKNAESLIVKESKNEDSEPAELPDEISEGKTAEIEKAESNSESEKSHEILETKSSDKISEAVSEQENLDPQEGEQKSETDVSNSGTNNSELRNGESHEAEAEESGDSNENSKSQAEAEKPAVQEETSSEIVPEKVELNGPDDLATADAATAIISEDTEKAGSPEEEPSEGDSSPIKQKSENKESVRCETQTLESSCEETKASGSNSTAEENDKSEEKVQN